MRAESRLKASAPKMMLAALDLAFLPVLAWAISIPIIKSKQFKSLLFVGLLVVMTAGNALIHVEMLEWYENTAHFGIRLITAAVIVMILVISGRIFPFFTERRLSGVTVRRSPLLNSLSISAAVAVFILDIFNFSGVLTATLSMFAALINFKRVGGWYSNQIWSVPLLWVLYLGYGWIIIGFMLMALSVFSPIFSALALHAFTLGGIGVLTLGMMARVSLGHTGRILEASNSMALGFVLINLAAFLRVLLPAVFPSLYSFGVFSAALLWLLSFLIFLAVNLPILVAPRADGKVD